MHSGVGMKKINTKIDKSKLFSLILLIGFGALSFTSRVSANAFTTEGTQENTKIRGSVAVIMRPITVKSRGSEEISPSWDCRFYSKGRIQLRQGDRLTIDRAFRTVKFGTKFQFDLSNIIGMGDGTGWHNLGPRDNVVVNLWAEMNLVSTGQKLTYRCVNSGLNIEEIYGFDNLIDDNATIVWINN